MTTEEKKEQVVQMVANHMRNLPFTVELHVKKRPKGIKIIYEMTQEDMDELVSDSLLQKGIIKTTDVK